MSASSISFTYISLSGHFVINHYERKDLIKWRKKGDRNVCNRPWWYSKSLKVSMGLIENILGILHPFVELTKRFSSNVVSIGEVIMKIRMILHYLAKNGKFQKHERRFKSCNWIPIRVENSCMRHSIPFHRTKNITTSEWFEILYTFTTTCCKNILKVSGPTPLRKPNYGIFKFSIFLVYSCFSNPETLDKIRIFSSSLWNFPYFSTI